MKKTISLLILFLAVIEINAQPGYLQGCILESGTDKPLFGASIYFTGNPSRGTISNRDGEFLLMRDDVYDSITVSYLGYHSGKFSVAAIPPEIHLRKKSYLLDNIKVYPVQSIVKQVWDRYYSIYKNEKKKPGKARKKERETFFYRQLTVSDSIYTEFIECFFTAGNSFGISDIRLHKGRFGLYREDGLTHVDFRNFFYLSQMRPFHQAVPPKDVINVFIQPNSKELYDTKVVQVIDENSESEILVVEFTPKPEYENTMILTGRLYIRLSDLSILRMISYHDLGVRADRGVFKTESFISQIDYIEGIKDYPVVGSIVNTFTGTALHNETAVPFKVSSTLLHVDYPYGFSNQGRGLKKKDTLLKEVMRQKYDPGFWKDNPVIKRTPIEESVIEWYDRNEVFGNFDPAGN